MFSFTWPKQLAYLKYSLASGREMVTLMGARRVKIIMLNAIATDTAIIMATNTSKPIKNNMEILIMTTNRNINHKRRSGGGVPAGKNVSSVSIAFNRVYRCKVVKIMFISSLVH